MVLSVVSTERSARGIPERKIIRGSTIDFTGLEIFYRMVVVGKICMYWIVYGFIHADGAFKKIELLWKIRIFQIIRQMQIQRSNF